MKLWHVCQCSLNQAQINLRTQWWATWQTNRWLPLSQCRQTQCKPCKWTKCRQTQCQWCRWIKCNKIQCNRCKWVKDFKQIQIHSVCSLKFNLLNRTLWTNPISILHLHWILTVDLTLWIKSDSQVSVQVLRNQVVMIWAETSANPKWTRLKTM